MSKTHGIFGFSPLITRSSQSRVELSGSWGWRFFFHHGLCGCSEKTLVTQENSKLIPLSHCQSVLGVSAISASQACLEQGLAFINKGWHLSSRANNSLCVNPASMVMPLVTFMKPPARAGKLLPLPLSLYIRNSKLSLPRGRLPQTAAD